ncbi:CRISPR/Cas system CMR-associated protein Cmr5 small subunit [Lewinella aquimaris]|uniref:CRISPR type III-B/RAMP module-associated protein Cmr5 n=1 Tax=Neolewinella aquimaris TaxID=1835722 RepID=A0A840E8Q2_9BACT|nr:type III-B CRISPR module-associated protein Cmr5 [Neolewinella aquimaris]MBB4080313.1 CRISPR/Cas system CMR-associated protein Cmr5 small subunit [Neolewinella aquimaris]
MKDRINKLLPQAYAAVKAELSPRGEPIQKEYQGYISSFGASVMQMGLLPTLAVFADKKVENRKEKLAARTPVEHDDAQAGAAEATNAGRGNAGKQENPRALLNILHAVVCSDASSLSPTVKHVLQASQYERITSDRTDKLVFEAAIAISKRERDISELRTHLLDAAVAVKLAIRTFKLE